MSIKDQEQEAHVCPFHMAMAAGAALVTGRGRQEPLEVCPSALPSPKTSEMKVAAAKGNLTLLVSGINPIVINQKQDVAFTELSSFGSFEINQNDFTWPRLLQAYICSKHLFFKLKELRPLLFLFLLPHSPHLSLSFLLHIHFSFLLSPGSPPNVKIERMAERSSQ